MPDKLWKATERDLAKRLGGKRVPVNSTDGVKCDVSTPVLSVEVKERQSLPDWLTCSVTQAENNCEVGKLPVVILHLKGQRHDNDLLVIELKHFEEWYI